MRRAGTAAPPTSRRSALASTRSPACWPATVPARPCHTPMSSWPPAAAPTVPPPRQPWPPGARSEQDDGATALHLAASAGSTSTVRLLLEHGADIEARDTTWDSTPLEWAIVGSGLRLGHDPHPDWPATVAALLDAGASTEGIVLSPDDPKPPSPEVAALLRARGIPERGG